MIFRSFRCYLCYKKSSHASRFFCESCALRLQNLLWYHCARCGSQKCGACDELKDFKNVSSLFSYSCGIPEILVLAKGNENSIVQSLFFDMYFEPVKKLLLELFLENKYDVVILSPLREERILESYWHTTIFFQRVLNFIKEKDVERIFNFKVFLPLALEKSHRQASIPSSERIHLFDFTQKRKIFLDKSFASEERCFFCHKILFLDDVLTTGVTALKSKRALEDFFYCENWDLCTLFRTPRSEAVSTELANE